MKTMQLAGCQVHFREIRDSTLVILEGARHPCYLDQPEKWHEELTGFLDR